MPSAEENQPTDKNQGFPVRVEVNDLHGKYTNLARISHTAEEFFVDFFMRLEDQTVLQSRVITSPTHAKKLAMGLATNIELYEKKFGEIKADLEGSVKSKKKKRKTTSRRTTARTSRNKRSK